jgi:HAD superfamily hydrolase (TIGR01509 family)
MKRAVLFDLDDTLLEYRRPLNARALFDAGTARIYACLTSLGCSLPAFEPFARRQRAIARRIAWATRLTRSHPDGRRLLRRLCSDYRLQRDETSLAKLGWIWYQPTADAMALPPDVIPTLTALREVDVKLALVVNTPHLGAVIDQHLDSVGLLEFFPVRVYSSEIEASKPNPRPYQTALEQLGVSAPEAIFVGDDAAKDLAGARCVGMQTVLRATSPQQMRERRFADHVIERIEQLLDIFQLVVEHAGDRALPPLPPLKVPAASVR